MVAGQVNTCTYSLYAVGSDTSGNIALDHADSDTPANNACLEYDSNCAVGNCNWNADHLYTITNNVLAIDYFGTADSGAYGVSYLE